MEIVFPNYEVRLIAINDAVDTLYGDNDFAHFRNLFNDFYAKDPDNPKQIVQDFESAKVVRYIFKLVLREEVKNKLRGN